MLTLKPHFSVFLAFKISKNTEKSVLQRDYTCLKNKLMSGDGVKPICEVSFMTRTSYEHLQGECYLYFLENYRTTMFYSPFYGMFWDNLEGF